MPNQCGSLGRTAAVILVGLLVWGLSGCAAIQSMSWLGGDKDPNPPTELVDYVQEVGLDTLWTGRVTKGGDGRRLHLIPALSNGRLYVADARGLVVALDPNNGRVLWERETGLDISAGPVMERDQMILGTSSGQVVTLSASDGREIWRATVGSEVLSSPHYTADGKLIVHTLNDTVHSLDGSNGAELWRISYPPPALTLRGSGSPTITPSGILVGLSGGKLVKLDPVDGAPIWEVTITPPRGRSELARISDIDADPVVVGAVVFVGTYNGDLAAVDIASGAVLWRRQLSSYAGLAANEVELFVTDSTDQIWGADPVSGAGRWKQERLRYRQLTAPTLIGTLIAVGDLEGYIHLLAQADGRLMGRTRVTKKGVIDSAPLVSGNRLFVYGNDGTLAVLTTGSAPAPSSGALKNRSTDGGDTSASPADPQPESPASLPTPPSI